MICVELCWPSGHGSRLLGRTSIGPSPVLPSDDEKRSRRPSLRTWIESSSAGSAIRSGRNPVTGGVVVVGVGVGVSVGVVVGVGVGEPVVVSVGVGVTPVGPAARGERVEPLPAPWAGMAPTSTATTSAPAAASPPRATFAPSIRHSPALRDLRLLVRGP